MSKILIVDDVPTNIKVLVQALKNPDYEIMAATNGQEALTIANSERPDLILLDIMMPEMDGYEVCAQLKKNKATEQIPVIFVTVKDEDADEARGLDLGAVDYITKPIRAPIVKARVRNHLELKRQRDLLEKLSSVDGLTGIPNRRRFDEFMDLEWRRTSRTKSPLSIIMMDIDYFKRFNDHYGHALGDDCLRQVAHTLSNFIKRTTDLVARYGGEEFICVLPLADLKDAVAIANRIRSNVLALEIPHACSSVSEFVTMSLGVATTIPTLDITQGNIIDAADKALYEAKAAGRNQVKGYYVNDIVTNQTKLNST